MRTISKGFVSIVERAGNSVNDLIRTLRAMAGLLYDTIVALFRSGGKVYSSSHDQIVRQILFTGVEAFWLVSLIGLLCGVTIVIQATANLPRIGAGEYFGRILAIVVIRELGPFFTAIVVIGRSGAALAAYIGNMRVDREIDALEMMGIDPVHFLVMPAFIGMVVSMVCLNIYFDVIAVLGGVLVGKLTVDIPFAIFVEKVVAALSAQELFWSLLKSVIFGIAVCIISCYRGLNVTNVREVPRAVHRSVVGSMIATILVNIVFTIMFYAR